MEYDRIVFFDTTLRDGEQSPGTSLTGGEKLEIARQLARLGVDVIEAGFPAASKGDLEAVRAIAAGVGASSAAPAICGLARAVESDIVTCWQGIREAARPRLHTFLGTSKLHLEHQTGLTPNQALVAIQDAVSVARSLAEDVQFSPMDAGRTDPGYLVEACLAATESGASTLNVPDTVGYQTPDEWRELLARLIAETSAAGTDSSVAWSVHCHDDLGLATANTLAGVQAGVRQVEVTVNGIGERAGNASLEEVAMALVTRRDNYGVECALNTAELTRTSRLVEKLTGIPVQPNKAVVGTNAFAHEAGIHQDGVLKHAGTYEIMNPESVGLDRNRIVLGKHSGRHALAVHLEELGYELDRERLDLVFARFKDLADRHKMVAGEELAALAARELSQPVAE